ncbi:hypothetical protein DJ021_14510 [Phenylobacterium hankyongense]|uniref:Uncharacterized protein n=1 Tax=Phenylobacterium hankyongense TaxID=1813876 RepID=A0A328B327_9CAUL|nr:hypothetical protein [Phenylobacterium hankyongense]RAK60935.1 hypothetical protein DJ021_14510 [Phenylobacterium hankyongense]
MSALIHFIVARSRHGWAVNVEADLLSEHADVREAREEAAMLAEATKRAGYASRFVDLSCEPPRDVEA